MRTTDTVVRVDDIQHPLLKNLFEYWQALASAEGVARKSAFDPVELPTQLWGRLFIIDLSDEGKRRRLRLMGTYIIAAVGQDFTGWRLAEHDIPGITGSITYQLLEKLIAEARPQYFVGSPAFPATRHLRSHEQLVLPLTTDQGSLSAAVGGIDYVGFAGHIFDQH